ncbi:putative ankyrin repeat protein RF_0381 [Aspergillus lentulus]|nr:putative ankyrin repeat protein RF_0381 [Aspergillus lentulus]
MEDTATQLVSFPPEIILDIGDYLWLKDLNSFVQTAKLFNTLLSTRLYALGAKHLGETTSPLIRAVQYCPISAVRKLLDSGADPSILAGKNSAFLAAITRYRPKVLKILVEPGVSASTPITKLKSPLSIAVTRWRLAPLRILLNAAPGCYPDEDGAWMGALNLALVKDRVRAARLLLEAAAKTTSSPLQNLSADTIYSVLYRANPEILRLLVDFGWDPLAPMRRGDVPLHIAAQMGKTDLVQLLLLYGADVNVRDGQHATPLHLACVNGQLGAVELLLNSGTDVNAATLLRETPLHQCMHYGSLPLLELLLDAGANTNVLDENGVSPLHIGISLKRPVEMIERLIQAGADLNALDPHSRTPLFLAAKSGNARLVKALVDAGAHVAIDKRAGSTGPLHVAATEDNFRVIQPLVDAGLDIEAPDFLGRTPLYLATINNCLYSMRELIRLGADPNRLDHQGESAAYGAITHNHTEALKFLLESGAEVARLRQDGTSLLHDAATHGAMPRLITYLLDYGAEPLAITFDGKTALHYAVANNQYKPIAPLLEAGTPIEARDNNGDTALLIAASRSCEGTRELLKRGADVNARARDGRTPLHHCSSHTDSEIYTMLINAGADIAARDELGQTPLHSAAAAANYVVCDRLLAAYAARGLDYMGRDAAGRTVLEVAAITGEARIIENLVHRKVDVNIGLHTDHGKHRGIPALHYAILSNESKAVTCLARRGAEYQCLDVYGRSAIDWASIDHSGALLRELSRHSPMTSLTSAEEQISILKSSVVGLATRIMEGDRSDVYKLAKCLQYLDDKQAAGAIYAEVDAYCDVCDKVIPKSDIRFICEQCPAIDLCSACMTKYEEQNMRIRICQAHQFWRVVVLEQRLQKQMADGGERELTRAEWLKNLIEVYREGTL